MEYKRNSEIIYRVLAVAQVRDAGELARAAAVEAAEQGVCLKADLARLSDGLSVKGEEKFRMTPKFWPE